jgi:ComF family protein
LIATHYSDLISEAIKLSKYRRVSALYTELAEIMLKRVELGLPRGRLVFIPIPLHSKRKGIRGFNQAEILCGILAKELGIEMVSGLVRIRDTKSQTGLPRAKRLVNVRDAFAFRDNPLLLEGKVVVLIDDVVTTGATLSESARVLKSAGARNVWGFVVAKK